MTEIDYSRYDLKNLTQAKLRQSFQSMDWKTKYNACMHDAASVQMLLDEVVEVTEYAILLMDTETLKSCIDIMESCVVATAHVSAQYVEVGKQMLRLAASETVLDRLLFVRECSSILTGMGDISKKCYTVTIPPPPVTTGKGSANVPAPAPVITIQYPWQIVFVCRLSFHVLKGVSRTSLSPFLTSFTDLTQSLQLVINSIQLATPPPPLVNGKPPKELPVPVGVVLPSVPMKYVNGIHGNMSEKFGIKGGDLYTTHELYQDQHLQSVEQTLVAVSTIAHTNEAVFVPAAQTLHTITPLTEGLISNFHFLYTHMVSLTTCCDAPQAFLPPNALQKYKNTMYNAVKFFSATFGACKFVHSVIHQLSPYYIASNTLFDVDVPLVNVDILEGSPAPLNYISSHLLVVSSIAILQYTSIHSSLNVNSMLVSCLNLLGIKTHGYSNVQSTVTPYLYGVYNASALTITETKDSKEKGKVLTQVSLLPKVQSALSNLKTVHDVNLVMGALTLETLELLPILARICLLHKAHGLAQQCMILTQSINEDILDTRFPSLSYINQSALCQLSDITEMQTLRKDRNWSVWYPQNVALTRLEGNVVILSNTDTIDRTLHIDYAQYYQGLYTYITPNAAYSSLPGLTHPVLAKKNTKSKAAGSDSVDALCLQVLPLVNVTTKGNPIATTTSVVTIHANNSTKPGDERKRVLSEVLDTCLQRTHDILIYTLSTLKENCKVRAQTQGNALFLTQTPFLCDLLGTIYPILSLFYTPKYYQDTRVMRCVSMFLALQAHLSVSSNQLEQGVSAVPVEKAFLVSYEPIYTTERLLPIFLDTIKFFMQYSIVKERYSYATQLYKYIFSFPAYTCTWEYALSTYISTSSKDKQPVTNGIASKLIEAAGPHVVCRLTSAAADLTGLLQSSQGLLLLRVEQVQADVLDLLYSYASVNLDRMADLAHDGLKPLFLALQCTDSHEAMVALTTGDVYGRVQSVEGKTAVERLLTKLKLPTTEKVGFSKGRSGAIAQENSANSGLTAHVTEVLQVLEDRNLEASAQLLVSRFCLKLASQSTDLQTQIKCYLTCIRLLDLSDESMTQDTANSMVCACISLLTLVPGNMSQSRLEEVQHSVILEDISTKLREDEPVTSDDLISLKLAVLKFSTLILTKFPHADGFKALLQAVYVNMEDVFVALHHVSLRLWSCTSTDADTDVYSHTLPVQSVNPLSVNPIIECVQAVLVDLATVCVQHYNIKTSTSIIDTVLPLVYPSTITTLFTEIPSHDNGTSLLPALLVPLFMSLAATDLSQCISLLASTLSKLPTLYVMELIPLWTHLMVAPLLTHEVPVKTKPKQEEGKKEKHPYHVPTTPVFDPFVQFPFPPNPVLIPVCVAALCTLPKKILSTQLKTGLVQNIHILQTASLKAADVLPSSAKPLKPSSPPAVQRGFQCNILHSSMVEAAKTTLTAGKNSKMVKTVNSSVQPVLLPYASTDYALLPSFLAFTALSTTQKSTKAQILTHFSALDHTIQSSTHPLARFLATVDYALTASLAWQLLGESSVSSQLVANTVKYTPNLGTLALQSSALYQALNAFYMPAELHIPGKHIEVAPLPSALLLASMPYLVLTPELYYASSTQQALAPPMPEPSPSSSAGTAKKHVPMQMPIMSPPLDNVLVYTPPSLATVLSLAMSSENIIQTNHAEPSLVTAKLTYLAFVSNIATMLSLNTKTYTNNVLVLLRVCVSVLSDQGTSVDETRSRVWVEKIVNSIVRDLLTGLPDSSLNLDQGKSVHHLSIFSQVLLNTLASTLILCDLATPALVTQQTSKKKTNPRVVHSRLYFHMFFLLSKILCTSQYTAHYTNIHALLSCYLSPSEVPRFIVFRVIAEAETGKDLSSLTPLLSNAMNIDKTQAAGTTLPCGFSCCSVKDVVLAKIFAQAVNSTHTLHAQLTALREAYKAMVKSHAKTHLLEIVVQSINWCASVLMQSGAAHVIVSSTNETSVAAHIAPSTFDTLFHTSSPAHITGETIDSLIAFALHLALPTLTDEIPRNMYYTCKTFQTIPQSQTTCSECQLSFGCSVENIPTLRAYTAVLCLNIFPIMLFRSKDQEQTKEILDTSSLMCQRILRYICMKLEEYKTANQNMQNISTWMQHLPSMTDDVYQFTQAGFFNHNIHEFVSLPDLVQTELPEIPEINSSIDFLRLDVEQQLHILAGYAALPATNYKARFQLPSLEQMEDAVEAELTSTNSLALTREQAQNVLHGLIPPALVTLFEQKDRIYEGLLAEEILKPLFVQNQTVQHMVHGTTGAQSILPVACKFVTKLSSFNTEETLQMAPIHILTAVLSTIALNPTDNLYKKPMYSNGIVVGIHNIDFSLAPLKSVDISNINLADAQVLNLIPSTLNLEEQNDTKKHTDIDLYQHYCQNITDSNWYYLDLIRRLALNTLHDMDVYPTVSIPKEVQLYIIAAHMGIGAAIVVRDKQAQLHALTANHPLLIAKDACYHAKDETAYNIILQKTCNTHLPAVAQPVILQSPIILLRLASLFLKTNPVAASQMMRYIEICMHILEKPSIITFPNQDPAITQQACVYLGNTSRTNITRLIEITNATLDFIHMNGASALQKLQTSISVQHGNNPDVSCTQCSTNGTYETLLFDAVKLHLLHNTAFAITPSFAQKVGIDQKSLAPSTNVNNAIQVIGEHLSQYSQIKSQEHLVRLLLVRSVFDLVSCRSFTLPSHLACLLLSHSAGKSVDLVPIIQSVRTHTLHLLTTTSDTNASFEEQFQLSQSVLQTLSVAADTAKKANNKNLWCICTRFLILVKTCLFLYAKLTVRDVQVTHGTTELCLAHDITPEDAVLYYATHNTGYGELLPNTPVETAAVVNSVISENFEASPEMFLFSAVGNIRDLYSSFFLSQGEDALELSFQAEFPNQVCFTAEMSQVFYLLHHTCIAIGLKHTENILLTPTEPIHVLAMLSSMPKGHEKSPLDIQAAYVNPCMCKAANLCHCRKNPIALHIVYNMLVYLQASLDKGVITYPPWNILISTKSKQDAINKNTVKDQDNWVYAIFLSETITVLSELTRYYAFVHQFVKLPKFNQKRNKKVSTSTSKDTLEVHMAQLGLEEENTEVDPMAALLQLSLRMTPIDLDPVKPSRGSSGGNSNNSMQQANNNLLTTIQCLLSSVPLPSKSSLSAMYSAATLHSSICSTLLDYTDTELNVYNSAEQAISTSSSICPNSALTQSANILLASIANNSAGIPVPVKAVKKQAEFAGKKPLDFAKKNKKFMIETPVTTQTVPLVAECAEAFAAALVAELYGESSPSEKRTDEQKESEDILSDYTNEFVEQRNQPYIPLVHKRVQSLTQLLDILPVALTSLSRGGFFGKLQTTLQQSCYATLRTHSQVSAALCLSAKHLHDKMDALHLDAGINVTHYPASHLLPKELLASKTQFSQDAIDILRVYFAPKPVLTYPMNLLSFVSKPLKPVETEATTLVFTALQSLSSSYHAFHDDTKEENPNAPFYVANGEQHTLTFQNAGIGSNWVKPRVNTASEFASVHSLLKENSNLLVTLLGEGCAVCELLEPLLQHVGESLTTAHAPVYVCTSIPAVCTPITFVVTMQADKTRTSNPSTSNVTQPKQSRGKKFDRNTTNRSQHAEISGTDKAMVLNIGAATNAQTALAQCGWKSEQHYAENMEKVNTSIFQAFAQVFTDIEKNYHNKGETINLLHLILATLFLAFTESQYQTSSTGGIARKQTKGKTASVQKTVLSLLPVFDSITAVNLAAYIQLAHKVQFPGYVPQILQKHVLLYDTDLCIEKCCSLHEAATIQYISSSLHKLPLVSSKRTMHSYTSMKNSLATMINETVATYPFLATEFNITLNSTAHSYNNEKGVLTVIPSPPETVLTTQSVIPQHIHTYQNNGHIYRAGVHLLLLLNVCSISTCVNPKHNQEGYSPTSLFTQYNGDEKRRKPSSSTNQICPILHVEDQVSVITAKGIDKEQNVPSMYTGANLSFQESLRSIAQLPVEITQMVSNTCILQYNNEYIRKNEDNQLFYMATLLSDKQNTAILLHSPGYSTQLEQNTHYLEIIALWSLLTGIELPYFTNINAQQLQQFIQQIQVTVKHIDTFIQNSVDNVQNAPLKKGNNKNIMQTSEDIPILKYILEQFQKIQNITQQKISFIQAPVKHE